MEELIVNGKHYPMWSQFIQNKNEWIGGTLEDFGDAMDRALTGEESMQTKIKDITLEPNGPDSAMFSVIGEDFDCGADVKHLGITGGEEPWLTLSGFMGHTWRFKKPEIPRQ